MDELLASLKAVAETTRLRLLFVLSHGEFNVSELTQILGQSQPRISRHLKLMGEAGLLSRYKEGSWVLFRLREEGAGGALARAIVDLLPGTDRLLAGDLARLEAIRAQRAEAAQRYFRTNAEDWDRLRSLHVSEEAVESAMLAVIADTSVETHIDLGTGTGRILELFAPFARNAIGIDSSREMLALARVRLDDAGMRHAQVRQADIYALPFANASADRITLHQVLHFLDEPGRAIEEIARIMKPGGRAIIVDFAPHELEQLREQHAHRRLGIPAEGMAEWVRKAGLRILRHDILPPPWRDGRSGLTVSLWELGHAAAMRAQPARHTIHTPRAERAAR
jgi:ubiquinone/menaquinone biosynthesis C-methylase UbiE